MRNPMNHLQISKIRLTPDVADGFVFWTKNPGPMIPRLRELDEYAYYFQFTLTPYGKDIEPGLPAKIKLLSTFHSLADRVGPHRIIWRYDPILINDNWTVDTHLRTFEFMTRILEGSAHKVRDQFFRHGLPQCAPQRGACSTRRNLPPEKKLSMAGENSTRSPARCGMGDERVRFGHRPVRLRRRARALRGRRPV